MYVLNRYDGWDTEGNASIVELKNLSRLTTLEIKVKDDKLLPEDWFFNGIQNYKIIIGDWDLYDAKGTSRMLMLELKTNIGLMDRIKEFLGGTEVLYLRDVNGIKNLLCDSSMEKINFFQRLRILQLKYCDSLTEVLPFSKCLPQLQEMEVRSCSRFEAIVGEGNEGEVIEFPQLTSLELRHLPHLRGFCRTNGMVVSFPSLTSLEIYNCKSLKYVFTTPMVKCLKQLKKLKISSCNSMEEIIYVTKFGEVAEDGINMILFPELDFLRLDELPNLERFSSGYPIKFPKLKKLQITTTSSMICEINESSDEYLFNDAVIPNVEVLTLDHHSLKAIPSNDNGFSVESLWKLKEVTLVDLEEESVPFLFDFLRRMYTMEKLTFQGGYFKEILSLLDGRAVGDQEQQYHLGP